MFIERNENWNWREHVDFKANIPLVPIQDILPMVVLLIFPFSNSRKGKLKGKKKRMLVAEENVSNETSYVFVHYVSCIILLKVNFDFYIVTIFAIF